TDVSSPWSLKLLREGDEILVIAEDDDTYSPGPLPEILKALLALGLVNIKLVHRVGNAVIKKNLETLPLETFDSVHWTNERPLENIELNAIIGTWFTLWRDYS
ncbi:hypothetical protein Tco_1279702, partial [Tanacetum coccineum]